MFLVTEPLLKSALQEGQIIPYFQPHVSLEAVSNTGFEALARWLHPERGLVSPIEFIVVAEQTGLIGELTETILAASLDAAMRWPTHLTLSVNVSPLQFQDASFPEKVSLALRRTGFPAPRLTLEIVESALMDDFDMARSIAGELKSLGVRLALDDFGTGYSSFRHLHELPVDELKIDAQFVRSMVSRHESRKIIAAIVNLGHSLNLATVAEGIESQAQVDMLRAFGCDRGQGWLFGPPIPEEQIENSIRFSGVGSNRYKNRIHINKSASIALVRHAPFLPDNSGAEQEPIEVNPPKRVPLRGALYALLFEGAIFALIILVWALIKSL